MKEIEEEEEATLEQKQKYLRENVLEKGYDPDKFSELLIIKKGQTGTNLDNWSLQELITVTNEFLKEDKDQNKDNKDNNNKKENEPKEDNKSNSNNIPEKTEEKEEKEEKNILLDNKKDKISCCLIEKTPITKIKELKIEVKNPKIEKGGIFSFSHSTYIVSTPVLELEVCRKHNDFIWLYNILKNHFGNCIVPPFIKKKDI